MAPRLIVAIDIAPFVRWVRRRLKAARPRVGEIDDDLANAPIPLENELEFLSLFKC
jgi:hypothetical protein